MKQQQNESPETERRLQICNKTKSGLVSMISFVIGKIEHSAMSFGKAAASAAILILLSSVGATAKPIVTTADTNLRKSPGTDSPVLTLVPMGTMVEVGKCSNGWCQASLNGQDGYVIARNVGMATARRVQRGPVVVDEEVEEDGPPVVYGPGPAYVIGPPAYGYGPYYGYGAYYGYYGGWGYRGGWGRRW
jgi:uncharacterized protein YraI